MPATDHDAHGTDHPCVAGRGQNAGNPAGNVPPVSSGPTTRGLPIEIAGLTKHFGSVLAVDHLEFVVEPGRVTGFLGPNGSGKTTTLRMLLGLVHPNAGSATVGGQLYRDLPNPSATVGAVLEATSFHPARRARTHLRMVARAGGHDEARADVVLDLVGLTADAKRKVGGFSMGMRQRLELASALVGDPDVLILDEPSNGLDPQGIAWLRDFMRYLAGEGRTILVSSHLLAEMAQTIDNAVIVSHGQLKAQGTLESITAGVAQASMHARTPEADRLCALLTDAQVRFRHLSFDLVAIDGMTPEQLGPFLAANQIILYELTNEGADLESIFLALTSGLGFGELEQPT
jgi:ABC-2 type transport system ATP-binding protein